MTVKAYHNTNLSQFYIKNHEAIIGRRIIILLVERRTLRYMNHFLSAYDLSLPIDQKAGVIPFTIIFHSVSESVTVTLTFSPSSISTLWIA